MNRHERRRLNKGRQNKQPLLQRLTEAIKTHSSRNFDLAEIGYKKILEEIPNDYETNRHLGILYYDTNRTEEAYKIFQKTIKLNPARCEAYNNLGHIHVQNDNYELAEKCLLRSHQLKQDYLPALNNLSSLYNKFQKIDLALLYAKKAINLEPNNPIAMNQYAKALIGIGSLEESIKIFETLCKNYPSQNFLINLTSAYREIGEFEKSDKIIREQFKKDYRYLDFFTAYAIDKSNKLNDDHIKYYVDIVENGDSTRNKDKIKICESFYLYYKNQKNFKKSAEYLLKMNQIQFSMKEYDLKLENKFFDTLQKISIEKISFYKNKSEKVGVVPIFICGMPRSGTTLCEQILSSHSNVTGAGELNYLADLTGIGTSVQVAPDRLEYFQKNIVNPDFLLSVRKQYLEKLLTHRMNDSQYICDKMPHNFVFIGLIKTIFPESKVIYCKRDPLDNCFSLYAHKFIEISHLYSYDQKTLAKYYKLHVGLMNYWLKNYKNDVYVLDNEELINNQEKISKALVKFCGLKWEKECLNYHQNRRQVRTASIEQVRQPLNRKSIGAWKKYETYLANLIEELNNLKNA